MNKILFVEDDLQLANVVSVWLQGEGYEVTALATAEEAFSILSAQSFDLLILDWELPGAKGVELSQEFRKSGGLAPVLILTGRSDLNSKVEGLDSGADDYLTKPFHFDELAARLKALMRRPQVFVGETQTISYLTINFKSRTVKVQGEEVSISPREFNLLAFLMMHPNHTYSAEALLDSVWPLESAFSATTVRSVMFSLRRKLTTKDGKCLIKTQKGSGYIIMSD